MAQWQAEITQIGLDDSMPPELFEKYVLQNHGTILVSDDGMSAERMLNVLWGWHNGRLKSHWMDWMIPCPQEFHLDMTLLQVRTSLNVIAWNVIHMTSTASDTVRYSETTIIMHTFKMTSCKCCAKTFMEDLTKSPFPQLKKSPA